MTRIRLVRGFLTVGGWTMASRILGFIRDVVIAATLGAGPVAEAFVVAFSLPNMFRRFFAEGAFNMAFVPMFSKRVESGEGAHEFARDALTGLGSILIVFTLAAQVFMPVLVLAMASGFLADERFDLAVLYGRIAFPYILFISLAALLSGVLVWVAAANAGYRLVPRRPRMTPELKRLAIIAAPAALAGGVVQINLLIGRQVASFFDGAIAWLNYADRLYQLPLGVVGIAIGVVLLPDLARKLSAEDAEGGRYSLSRAGEMALVLTVPCAVALLIIPLPMVQVLFQRGAFTVDDAAATAVAVQIYGLGLPAFVLQKVLQPVYFARENTRTPFYFALVAMVVNAGLAIGLAPVIGYTAAAIGTTLAGWAMAALLWIGTWRMGEVARFDARFWRRLWRIGIASWAMGAILWALALPLGPMLDKAGLDALALVILIVVGAASYFIIGHMIHAFRLSDFRAALRRG